MSLRTSTASRRPPRPAARRRLSGLAALGAWALLGCSNGPRIRLPAPVSDPPTSGQGVLRAGFGRADITPPPGLGLMGWGPEGRRAQGYRQRLYARALVLEDARGEKLALVALDMGQTSMLLHRFVADEVLSGTGIGADRLILAATHTHASMSHYFGVRAYNEFGSSVPRFDPNVVAFLVERIARAVREAAAGMGPARLAWGSETVWGLTRNRSLEAFRRNDPEWQNRFRSPPDVPEEVGYVDPRMTLLRVDLHDPATGRYAPAGAFTVFAMHGTGNPFDNQLYDSDLYGVIATRLERHLDSLNAHPRGRVPAGVHLVVNGAEGDVSPNMPAETRSRPPILARELRPGGPRSPVGREYWQRSPPSEQAKHIGLAREWVQSIGSELGARAISLFDGLSDRTSADATIARAFATVPLADSTGLELCEPRNGTATVGGAEDGRTRYSDWKLLYVLGIGFEEGGTAVFEPRSGCHTAKEKFLGPLYRLVADDEALPRVAQLTVARIGEMLLGATPFEATTIVGEKIRDAMIAGARPGGDRDSAVLIGLANGYNSYVATAEEYDAQHYEGGGTLYGPRTAEVLSDLMGSLASTLPAVGEPSPPAPVAADTVYPWLERRLLPSRSNGPPPEEIERNVRAEWRADTLFVHWNDTHPGRLVPADGPVLEIQVTRQGGWSPLTWDDDPDLEVWAIGPAGGDGYTWEARWSPGAPPTTEHRVVLLERPGLPPVESAVLVPP